MGRLKGRGGGGAALGKMGRFESPSRLGLTPAGLCVRAWCSLGMPRVVLAPEPALHMGTGQERHPSAPFMYRIPSKQGNCPACWDEQLEDQAAKSPVFPWIPVLTCCRSFTHIPLPAAVAFAPISSPFCFIHWQRPRCCRVLDTYVARFCWRSA